MFAYCLNNPANRVDVGGYESETIFDAEYDFLDQRLRELGGGGGSAYHSYLVRSATAAYDGALGGYHTSSVPSTYYSFGYYYVSGAVSVTDDMAVKPTTSGVCFIAGTPVVTATGYVPIEEITVGDLVVAHDPETGETALKEVVNTFVNEVTELIHIVVNGEEIVCTKEHPFYSPVEGWVAASDLRAGDILATLEGKCTVERVWNETLETPVSVYNFEVTEFHTYYVSVSIILVHNKCTADKSAGQTPPKNGLTTDSSSALDLASEYLGPNYIDAGSGRFISKDGMRQVRLGENDLMGVHGGGPHINFDRLFPTYKTYHVYFID
jgi:hypothetical protein